MRRRQRTQDIGSRRLETDLELDLARGGSNCISIHAVSASAPALQPSEHELGAELHVGVVPMIAPKRAYLGGFRTIARRHHRCASRRELGTPHRSLSLATESSTSLRDGRHAGLLVPLFSMRSTESWGIGEFSDVPRTAAWLRECGLDILQLLPLNEMATGQTSPYCALSAFALDPIYISLPRLQDFRALGGLENLSPATRSRLQRVQNATSIKYDDVRRLKGEALEAAFRQFLTTEWGPGTARAHRLEMFQQEQAWWLHDYALFRALHDRFDARAWTSWPVELWQRDGAALTRARCELRIRVLFYEYLQWIASSQWQDARDGLAGVGVFGDLPFMVSRDSADVWVRQNQFDLNASVGVPPDAFSDTGQDWGLPVYRWDVHAHHDFGWLRERAQRCADLYDGYRLDHAVGFYRTYVIPRDGEPYFQPAEEAQQIEQGERLMQVFCSGGQRVIAEDLGTVPDFVRQSLARTGIPGFKVLRWERDFDQPACPFRDPGTYPSVSVATTGTHDTEPMCVWWEHASPEERAAALQLPELSQSGESCDSPYSDAMRDRFVRTLFMSNADLVILPIQDVFGSRDRINVPATIGGDNWTYLLPWPVDRLAQVPEASEAAARMRRWAEASARTRHVSV
jgi:4-alpha-glucanotransferase